ncbi:hypothetical protein [Hwangdonia seohaensis]|uniref:GH26 domain-containing protein n=1 Tax=Hwangdonia seohaensis TaxID=1240727 RepID=A0ABW3RG54_9FLAO|nr:hypothetical protein [Hwangdonia seohaensis]
MTVKLYIVSFLLLVSCSKNEHNKNQNTAHLKYFGFAITDCGANYLNHVDDFVNLVDMCTTDLTSLKNRVETNTLNNNKVIIHLQGLFINPVVDSGSPTGIRYELLSNYAELFNTWKTNNTFISSEKVAAFTVADEPAWNNMNMADLATITKFIKQAFPNIPIMVIEAPDVIDNLEITDDIGWIGFDRYATLDPLNDPEYLNRLKLVKSKRTNSNQRLVLIMESQWLDYYSDEGFKESVLIQMANSYYELAKKENDVIALISYLLPSGFDTPDQKGFLDLNAEVQETIKAIGKQIVN